MEMEFDMNSNAVMDAFVNGFADEAPVERDEKASEGFSRKADESYRNGSGIDAEVPESFTEGYWDVDEDGEDFFVEDVADEDYVAPDDGDVSDNATFSSFSDMDDDYELELFSDDMGNTTKATKADVVEAFKIKERYEAMNKIIMGAGKDLQAYEEAVIDRIEGATYQSERIIAECQNALRSPHITSAEKAQAYDTIEREKQKLQMINSHVSNTRAERKKAELAANHAKVSSVSHMMMNAYRWDGETLGSVDNYLASTLPSYDASMLSPELLVLARKAMEADKGKANSANERISKVVKTSGNSVNASERAARKAASNKQSQAMQKMKKGMLSAGEMFSYLQD